MSSTIPQVGANANELFNTLVDTLVIDLAIPAVTIDLDIPLPSEDALTNEAYAAIGTVTLADLTTAEIDGSGVFDKLMTAVTKHLDLQFQKSRITGKEYAEVYLGGMQTVMAQAVNFLTNKDKLRWEALLAREQLKLVQLQRVQALVTLQLAKLQVVEQKLTVAKTQILAYTAKSEYASSKLGLAVGYTTIQKGETDVMLTTEQIDTARAQTKDTLLNGVTAVAGILAFEKQFKQKQMVLTGEQVDTARAATKNTLQDGSAVAGLAAVEKTLKLAQVDLSNEQIDTARAATKDTLRAGGAILGAAAQDKLIKTAQIKLINEQHETQRASTLGTRSDGAVIFGSLGAQTKLYLQQIESYKHDSKSKLVKTMLDTWTARKSINELVEVPSQIDTLAINASVASYRAVIDAL